MKHVARVRAAFLGAAALASFVLAGCATTGINASGCAKIKAQLPK